MSGGAEHHRSSCYPAYTVGLIHKQFDERRSQRRQVVVPHMAYRGPRAIRRHPRMAEMDLLQYRL